MSHLFLRRTGAAMLVLILLAAALPAQASHGDALHVSAVSDNRFTAGVAGQSLSFVVSNDGPATWDKLTISSNTATEVIAVTGASAPGWTASTPQDSDDPTDTADTVVLTGGTLSQFETLTVTFTFNALAQPGPGTVRVTGELMANPTPQSQSFGITVAAPGLTVSKTALTLAEQSTADSFTVALAEPPSGDVQLGFSVPATAASVSPATLTFTTADWDTPQTVTVTPVPDNKDTVVDRTATLLVQVVDANSAAEYDSVADASIGLTITDNDNAAIVATAVDAAGAPDGGTVVYEGGATDRIAVKLATFPRADTKVAITVSAPGQGQVTLTPTQLTFTPANGRTEQFVTITADDDTATEILSTSFDIQVAPIPAEASDEYKTVAAATAPAFVIDNEGAGFTIEQTDASTQVSEAAGANTDTFTVVLDRQPRANVVINLVATQGTQTTPEITVSPAPLSFTPANWNVPQTVTVTAINDQIPEATEVAAITATVDAGSSGEYTGVQSQTVSVSITDDDDAGFTIVQSGGSTVTTEDGTSDTVTVVLTRQPASPVIVKVTTSDAGEIAITPPGSSLTFTSSNWNAAQTVTVVGQDDTEADGHQDVDLVFAIGAGSDAKWASLPPQVVQARNNDNEAGVLAAPRSLTVTEGGMARYNLSLTVAPTSDVTVKIVPGSGATADVNDVVFTTSDWATKREVTLTAVDDSAVGSDRSVTVAHTIVAGGNYATATAQEVSLTIEEDDTLDIGDQNLALQKTVKVTRSGDANTITWDIASVDGEPAGVQIWRANSPFVIIANAEEGTAAYRLGKYTDDGASATSRYVATVFYQQTEEGGYFARGTSALDSVPGYIGASESALDELGASSPEEDSNTLLVVAIIIGLLVVAAVIVVVVLLARRKRTEDTWDEEWQEPESSAEDQWAVEPEAEAEPDAWSEEGSDEGWEAEPAPAWPEHEETPLETFHLTCPQCQFDFSVQGHKPLETECPSCGVTGVLR